jgi:prepilin-type N-terminal cleavage/methylation domain-containing protein
LVKRKAPRPEAPLRRGFTLVELLAAIAIIAVLASLATPSFLAIIRDRRVTQVGILTADSYREARTRSLARGIAVAVRWQSNGAGKGTLEIREAVVFAPGQGTTKGCLTADWSSASADTRRVSAQDFAASVYELASIQLMTEASAASAFGETCFTPDGRAYVRYADNGAFVAQTGVPRFEVLNTRTNLKRIVYLPPNGVARLAL